MHNHWRPTPSDGVHARRERGRTASERGSASVELVLLTPVLVSLLLLTVALGRIASVDGTVADAARSASRSASNARTAGEARTLAAFIATSMLNDNDAGCTTPTVSVDTSDWRPGGAITVAVACTISLADVAGFGVDGSRTLTAKFTEPLDRWKGLR